MKTTLPILLLLTSCGGRNEVHADCLTFHLDGTVDEAALAKNVVLARTFMDPLVPDSDFCTVYGDVDFEIRSDLTWDCLENPHRNCTVGETPFWGVVLNRTIVAMVHEMFHEWDRKHGGIPMPDPHAGWDTNGRDAADIAYEHAMVPINFKPL